MNVRLRSWVMVGCFALLVACDRKGASSAATSKPTSGPSVPKVRVRVVKPKRETSSGLRVYPGVLKPWQRAQLGARMPGELTTVTVDRGDRVEKGQLLATIGIPGLREDVQRAGANKQTAEAELLLLEDQRRRAEEVMKSGPRGAIAEGDLAALDAKIVAAKARISGADAERGRGGAMLKDTRIVAPFDGVVQARRADPGTALSTGSIVVEVADVSTLRLAVDVPERDAASVKLGQDAEVTVPAQNDRKVHAKLARFAPLLDDTTRTLRAEIDVPNHDGALLAGVAARAALDLGSRGEILVLPADAIVQEAGDAWVLVMDGDIARRRRVRVAYDRGPAFEISEGLTGSEEIVIGGRGLVRDGTACEVAR